MPASTPIARSKTAALSRVLDVVPRGYVRYTGGVVAADKAVSLARKFHQLYGIGATPAQRLIRKRDGIASALLVMYWPEGAEMLHWLMLVTSGSGFEREQLLSVTDKPHPQWLGYELVRHPVRGRTRWTWRRPKPEMAEHHAVLPIYAGRRDEGEVQAFLERLANQPGFHGVREQTWALFQRARELGYSGELPVIYHVQKVSHGERISVADE